MKKYAFLIPMVFFLGSMFVASRIFVSGKVNPTLMVIVMGVALILLTLFRPKNKPKTKPVAEVEAKIRGEFAKDAFADDAALNEKFQSALMDIAAGLPKSAYNKLTKLAPLCRNDREKYAVAMATAQVQIVNGKLAEAARNCTTALEIHPSSELAMNLGSCYQRLGETEKARDAYEYAHTLDNSNLDAPSAIATTYITDRNYEVALEYAAKVLEQNENHPSALATTAICYGLLDDLELREDYTAKAETNGYSRKRINETIAALKK